MSKQLQTLHLVMSLSAPGLLRRALTASGRRERVVGFSDCLALGPINPPAPRRRARWMTAALGHEQQSWDWLPHAMYGFWRYALQPGQRRIIWTSTRSANEFAAFLACVERCADEPYEVIDLADVDVEVRYQDGRRAPGKAISLGMLAPEVIANEALWNLAKPLSVEEEQHHLESWRRLKSEDAPLRIIGPGGLRSATLDYFDESLLLNASTQWRRAARVIADTMIDTWSDGYYQVADPLLDARLVALIQAGKLTWRLPGETRLGDPADPRLAAPPFLFEADIRRT